MDDIDKAILQELKNNARMTNAKLAEHVGLAPSAVLERVRKLERNGIITRYETRFGYEELGLDLTTFIQLRTRENIGDNEIGRNLASFPEIQEIHVMAGEYCYLLKARTRNTHEQRDLLKRIGAIGDVVDSRTSLVLETIKESGDVKL